MKDAPKPRTRAPRWPRRSGAIVDGRDLIDIAERALLRPLDVKAQAEIAAAARRVSMVTAISPRAILDVIFVVAQIVRLVRRIAEIYGGRPGLLGFVKLARSIRRAYRDHRRHGGRRQPAATARRPRHRLAHLGAHGRRRAQRPAHRARRPFRAGGLPPRPVRVDKPPGVAEVAPFLFGAGKDR